MALLRHSHMMDGNIDDTVFAVMEFLGMINSVYTELFLMLFLVLNDMFSFNYIFFYSEVQLFRDCHLTAWSVCRKFKSWPTLRSPLRVSVDSPAKMGWWFVPLSASVIGSVYWEVAIKACPALLSTWKVLCTCGHTHERKTYDEIAFLPLSPGEERETVLSFDGK